MCVRHQWLLFLWLEVHIIHFWRFPQDYCDWFFELPAKVADSKVMLTDLAELTLHSLQDFAWVRHLSTSAPTRGLEYLGLTLDSEQA